MTEPGLEMVKHQSMARCSGAGLGPGGLCLLGKCFATKWHSVGLSVGEGLRLCDTLLASLVRDSAVLLLQPSECWDWDYKGL